MLSMGDENEEASMGDLWDLGPLHRGGGRPGQLYSQVITKPPLSPPSIVFPIVWVILFALMGIGAARVYLAPPSGLRSRSLLLFLVQLAFNFFWSIIFFQFQNFGFALVWLAVLWALILWMLLSFLQVDCTAGWLQVPYLLWVTFAAYLNWGVWLLNPR